MSLGDLRALGFVVFTKASYYGRLVEMAGEITSVHLDDNQLFLEVKVSGTRDEGLLRVLSATPGRLMKVHVCPPGCPKLITGDLVAHGEEAENAMKDSQAWYTNVEEVVPPEVRGDELEALRREAEARTGAGGETPKKKAKEKTKKKEKKAKEKAMHLEVAEGAVSSGERGVKELSLLFSGTGLDPNQKVRKKMQKKARRLGKSSKKKKKKKSSSGSSKSSSSSSSSSPSSNSQIGEGLFDSDHRLTIIWKRYPGVLTAQAVTEAKQRLLTSSGTLWAENKAALPPLFTHYARQGMMQTMAPGMQQETLTICSALDLLLQGQVASCADLLSQRAKSLEALSRGGHWTVARQHELVRVDAGGIAQSLESMDAARRAKEEEKLKLMISRAPSGKGPDSSYGGGGKNKKGKEKGSGKGKGDDASKPKGGDGGKKEETWRKK